MVPLDRGTFRAWLDEYAAAWEAGDADAAAVLFAPNATYHETPTTVFEGRDAIRAYWAETTSTQSAVTVETTVEAVDRDVGVARFHAAFVRGGDDITVDGVLRARLAAGTCIEFREWWHRRVQR